MTFLNLPDQILIRCPVCGRSDMAPVGITYVFPGRCEMMLACPDEGCDGAVYTTMGDPSLVATFSDGLYGLIRVDSPEGPFLRLEGGGLSAAFHRSETGEPIASGDAGIFPENVFSEASAEAGSWFARRTRHAGCIPAVEEVRSLRTLIETSMDTHD